MNPTKIYNGCPSLFKQILADVLALATVTKASIDRFFPPFKLIAPFMSAMEATIDVSPALFTRLVWVEQNKSIKYDSTSELHIYQLKDIYAQYNYDWTTDPVLNPI
jgi:hypothetical protein